MIPGLVSVTFRDRTVREVCALCERVGLRAVEWGGDVHVPPEAGAARAAREMSADAGLAVCSYGSYFRVGDPMDGFLRCLDAAGELGAGTLRVWLGRKGSKEADAGERARTIECLAACCERAAARGTTVAPEFHGGTLTDEIASVQRLLAETAHIPNLRFYWQPRWDWREGERLLSLDLVLPRIAHVHAFTWRHADGIERLPLAAGEGMWKQALSKLDREYVLLEFVRDDREDAFFSDAETLRAWMDER